MASWEDLELLEFREGSNTTRIWHPKSPQIVCRGPRCIAKLGVVICTAIPRARVLTDPPRVLRGSQIMRMKNRDPDGAVDWGSVAKEMVAPAIRPNYTCKFYSVSPAGALKEIHVYHRDAPRAQILCEGYHWARDPSFVTVESCGLTYWLDGDPLRSAWLWHAAMAPLVVVTGVTAIKASMSAGCGRLQGKRPPWG